MRIALALNSNADYEIVDELPNIGEYEYVDIRGDGTIDVTECEFPRLKKWYSSGNVTIIGAMDMLSRSPCIKSFVSSFMSGNVVFPYLPKLAFVRHNSDLGADLYFMSLDISQLPALRYISVSQSVNIPLGLLYADKYYHDKSCSLRLMVRGIIATETNLKATCAIIGKSAPQDPGVLTAPTMEEFESLHGSFWRRINLPSPHKAKSASKQASLFGGKT